MNVMNSFGNRQYNVAAYERLSREDDRKEESSSIESQKIIIESFAKFSGIKITRHYSDDGFTGSNFNRPAFEQLIKDIEDGLINCVIVKDLSRLGRELYETGTYIEDYFLSRNVRFIAINDSYDSQVGDSMLGIRLSVNDMYLRDTSRKIRSSFDAKRERGDYIGSFAKYGYQKDPSNTKRLIIDPVTAPIVAQIFEWVASGLGTSVVAHRLTKLNHPIPSIYKKENRPTSDKNLNNGNGIWRPQTVKLIVTDMMYLGHMVQRRWKKISYTSKKLVELPKDEWIIVKNTHEPIVSQELFDKAQLTLEKGKKFIAKNDEFHLFQGLLVCKDCGHNMSITRKKRKQGYSYYASCNYYQKYSKYDLCTPHRINYIHLEEDLLSYLKEVGSAFIQNYEANDLTKKCLREKQKNSIQLSEKQKEIEVEISKTQDIISNLYEDRLSNVISTKQYTMLSKKYEQTLENLEKEQSSILKAIDNMEKDDSKELDECKKLIYKFMTFEFPTRDLMLQLIDKIEVDEDKNIEIFFNVNLTKYINLNKEKGNS